MKRIAFSVIVCLFLIELTLPSCTPGSGNGPLNLEPGSVVSGVDGVSVGAPEGTLDQAIQISIEKVEDPREEVPLPEYLVGADILGDFYGVSALQDVSTPDADYLVLGLPVPEGVSVDDLTFAVLVPPDSIIDEPDDSPSPRWLSLSGIYDPESGLYCTLLPAVLTEQQVFALLDPTTPGWAGWTDSGHFRVVSVGFNSSESPEAHRVLTADALNDAYAAYVDQLGFLKPSLRHPSELIALSPSPTVVLNLSLYEYQLVKENAPNGFYDPVTRTAGTEYPGAPGEPNSITPHHELFHAIQFAYPALRANASSWELHRTTEAAATAAELSLDGLTRSNRLLIGRDPLPVTRGLWSSAKVTSFDYAAQDFLVYLGRVIAPSDPQLEFMIPWFERGGLVADLDAVLQAGTTFNSLGDAYWQWVKNHAFEKQVILGKDSAEGDVPHGEACSWSGHGDLEHVSFSPETWNWGGDNTDFTLGSLTSRIFELTLNPGDNCYGVTMTVDSADPDIEFKFCEGGEVGGGDCWDEARDSIPDTFYVGETPVIGYLLVSNTNLETESDLVRLVAAEEEVECTSMVAAGSYHTVGLKSDGTVVAVGDNYYGQCNVGNWTNIVQVAAGYEHTLGLKSDGTVVAVGSNDAGQCNVGSWTNIVQVAAGGVHTVGLKSDGTVVAVGANSFGQRNVGGWSGIVQIAAADCHTVGLKAGGTVVAVGDNQFGQCNVGSWTGIIQVAAGQVHTVGLKSDGTVVAVGDNSFGQRNVGGWSGIVRVAAGNSYTVGLKSNGTVVAVGDNYYGQCNVGNWTNIVHVAAGYEHTVGVKTGGTVVAAGWSYNGQCNVGTWTNVAQVAAGRYDIPSHTVAAKSNGTVGAVGRNNYGQCNVGTWTDIIGVAAGSGHTVGVKSNGSVVAVGDNHSQQCNVGTWTNVIQVAAGSVHTVGLRSDGTVVAVGSNIYGQCNVSGWTNITQVAAGNWYTVGLKSDGTVVAVGDNGRGQCNVSGWTNIVRVAAGSYHTVGLKSDGTVVAVGDHYYGQCGVGGWSGIIQVAAGTYHTAGVKSDGTVVAVGRSACGPNNVRGWTNIVQVAASCYYTVGLKSDGTATAAGAEVELAKWDLF